MADRIKAGIIGCGTISGAYLTAAMAFPSFEIVAGADLDPAAAERQAARFGIEALPVEKLLADPSITIVINLTTPQSHASVNRMALEAGKHVHCEKPLALRREEARAVLQLAKREGLLVGCAPDTVLGAGQQTCRRLIDEGVIGRPVAGTAFMLSHGHESWHPNPAFYYLEGGGPLFDMGPYYLTALIHLLGPVGRVCASAARTFAERTITSKPLAGTRIPVEVPTHVSGTLDFHNGAVVTLVMSFDVWKHSNFNIQIHGELGSMKVPDPNGFGGPVSVCRAGEREWQDVPLCSDHVANLRGFGVDDLVRAIREGRQSRCSGEIAQHVLDVMHALHESSAEGRHLEIESGCARPEPLPEGLRIGPVG